MTANQIDETSCDARPDPTFGSSFPVPAPPLFTAEIPALECGFWPLLVDQPRLRREPDRSVGRAVAHVSAPLDDLEKEPLFEASGVDLQVLAASIAVVEDIVGPERVEPIRRKVHLRFQVIV